MSSPSTLSREECRKIIKRHLESESFEVSWYSLAPISSDIKGFMADHLRLRVSVSLDQGAKDAQLQFFVKTVPQDDAYRREFALSGVSYQKEVLFYGDMRRDLRKHLRAEDSESSTLLGSVPHCFYLRPDLLVLEDLGALGYRVPDTMQPLGLDLCEAALRALARLHATSLVFEEKEGRRLGDMYPVLNKETLYVRHNGAQYAAQQESVRCMHVLLDLHATYGQGTTLNPQLHQLMDAVMDSVYNLVHPSDKYRSVLSHRDLWTNNMLVAADEGGRLSVRLVDFQAIRLTPASYDVLTFLHLSTTRETRQHHGTHLLQVYHGELAHVLRRHDISVDDVFPFQVFFESLKEAKQLAVLLAAYILQFAMMPMQQGYDLEEFVHNRRQMAKTFFENDERYRKRMTECVGELVETCIMPRIADLQQ